VAGAKVRQGEINLTADSCHASNEMHCEGCNQLAAIEVDERWKTLT
jgi:hypothetical protein